MSRISRATERYFKQLGQELAPLQSSRGGPIVLIQIENEYSSYEGSTNHLRALSSQGGDAHAAVDELDLVGAGGTVLPRERWQVCHVDSEELKAENGSADNAVDGHAETIHRST
jgi:hypothetical protein